MKKDVISSLAWGGGIIAVALCASLARSQGLIDQEVTVRLVLGATGLMVAAFGDRIPKTFSPSALARQTQRFTAWAMVISGLVYAAAFAFAPSLEAALVVGCGAVVAGLALSFAYCLGARARAG